MRTLSTLVCLFVVSTAGFTAHSEIDRHGLKYAQSECPAVFEDLVKFTLWQNEEALSDLGFSPIYRNEVDTLKFVSTKDLDPGAFNVRRRNVFHLKVQVDGIQPPEQVTLTVITQGNYFCEDEKILSFESLVINWDI